jgi:nucleoid DNA-binding protein
MKKNDFIASLSRVLSTRKEAADAVDVVFEGIRAALRAGDKVVIAEVGTLQPVMARAKKGRNPNTGEALQIRPRRKVRFRQSKDLFKP